MGRRRFLAAGSAALLGGFPARLLAAAPRTGRAARVAADPAVTGSWTAPFTLGLVSIHAVLLHTGNVLLFSWPSDTVGSDAVLWNPVTGRITNIALTYQRDIFCSGTTVLSDGRVFIAGGHIWQGALNPAQGVINTTIFDPASSAWTEGWTEMAAQTAPRMYHSTALLLPDGRVLSAGQSSGKYEKTGEIFSPPYLFKGARPAITSAPATLGYRAAFTVTSPQAASIARLVLIKPGAVTHSCNFDQRYVACTFTASGTRLSAVAPPSANSAPPGWYLLFLVDVAGVPSVASWVHVG